MQSKERLHQIYLLTRKSDGQQYVGITIEDRIHNRMSQHRCTDRFREDDFTAQVIYESYDRKEVENLEEHYINKYDTFYNGLNNTKGGKGYGHNDPKFTTLGYEFTDEQKKNMSKSGKLRAEKEGFAVRSKRSKEFMMDGRIPQKLSKERKNKRMAPPKISDEDVQKIRKRFHSMEDYLVSKTNEVNEYRESRNPSWKKTNKERVFSHQFSEEYGVTPTTLYGIVSYKTRIKSVPLYENTNA